MQEYRRLGFGDIIQEGDECLAVPHGWVPANNFGNIVGPAYYRRPIVEIPQEDPKPLHEPIGGTYDFDIVPDESYGKNQMDDIRCTPYNCELTEDDIMAEVDINRGWTEADGKTEKQKFAEFMQNFFQECMDISKKKNEDYTAGDVSPFANFTAADEEWTEIGFYTRMNDKMNRIKAYIKNGDLHVKDESVTDTLQDLANYCCLFAGYINSKKTKA